MHKIHSKPITLEDFSTDKLLPECIPHMEAFVSHIEDLRLRYIETGDKALWNSIIQLLPSSYEQLRTVTMNYENLAFEVTFDLKPASDSSENIDALKFTGGSYNEDSGWVEGNHGFGILEPNPGTSGYVIVSMAESF